MNERPIILMRDTSYQVIHELWRALPPPVSDHPDDLVRRDNAAMAEVALLLPSDPAEAAPACRFVAACAHAMERPRHPRSDDGDAAAAFARCLKGGTGGSNHPPGTAEQGFSMGDAHPAAALARPDPAAVDVPPAQVVSFNDTKYQNNGIETLVRLGSLASPLDNTPDSLPGPLAASPPPHHANEAPDARSGRGPASFAPSQSPLPALDTATDAMNRTADPAGTMPRARAA